MEEKRAQVTVFVIIGVLIAAGILAFSYLQTMPSQNLPADIAAVKSKISLCFNDAVAESLAAVGLQGGYFKVPPIASLDAGTDYGIRIAYWYYNGQDIKPSVAVIQNQMDRYIEESIKDCVEFNKFAGMSIGTSTFTSATKIGESSVSFNVKWPITVKRGDSSYRLTEPYTTTLPVRLGLIYVFASEIVNKEITDPNSIYISYLLDTGMNVTILKYDENTNIYALTDIKPNTKLKGEYYTFVFANKFA